MKKKIMALCLVAILAITAIGGATLAYFNDTTEEVKNTFTMGKVEITLDEADINNPNGDRVTENDYADAIVPGHVFDKDPTIHVDANSEDCYVFLDVTINKFKSLAWVMAKNYDTDVSAYMNEGVFSTTKFLDALKADKTLREGVINAWFNEINHTDWQIMTTIVDGNYLTIRLAYIGGATNEGKAVVEGGKDIKFMDSFQMPATVTDEMIAAGTTEGGMQNAFNTDAADFKMSFKAYAIQEDTLTLDSAYAALFN